MPPPRLKDVAKLAGVTEATASYALNNKPGVSALTASRVRQAAEKLGYQMNPLVKALMEQVRSSNRGIYYRGTLAFLHFERHDKDVINDRLFRGQVFRGVVAQAKRHGFSIDLIPMSAFGDKGARVDQILKSRNITGVLVAPLKSLEKSVVLNWEQVSTVALGYTMTTPMVTRVAPDNFNSFFKALEIAWGRGYRRFALVLNSSDLDVRSNYGFTAALSKFCQLRKLKSIAPFVAADEESEKLKAVIAKSKPDFIFATSAGVYDYLLVNYPKIPCCLISNELPAQGMGLAQSPNLLGAVAVDELCAMVERNQRGTPEIPRQILIPLQFGGFDSLLEKVKPQKKPT